jgi:ubiquinone/menaquinone biosynthesis C-methylase UbiE
MAVGMTSSPGKSCSERDSVRRFWLRSTEDVISNVPTGLDISQNADSYWRFLDLWERETALFHSPDGVLLDLGCGTGRLTHYLSANGKNVVSVDYIHPALRILKEASSSSLCANMDNLALALKDESFTGVVSCRVLQSLPTAEEKERAVREIHRVLKRGGILVLTEGNPLRQKLVKVTYNFYLSLREWTTILKRNGFAIDKVTAIPFLTASRTLDKLSRGTLHRLTWPFHFANWLDRRFGRMVPHFLSLQIDIIARKL